MTTITNTHLTTPNIGLFEIPRRVSRPAEQFEAQLKNAQLAEDLGMHSYWAAQAHFSAIGLPSSLSVLSAVSQRTQHIRLGTAVITLAFENPIRLAETASVVNTLAHNRLELGVGKGNPRGRASAAYRAFGASEAQRGTLFEQQLQSLRQAFNHVEKTLMVMSGNFIRNRTAWIDEFGKPRRVFPPLSPLDVPETVFSFIQLGQSRWAKFS